MSIVGTTVLSGLKRGGLSREVNSVSIVGTVLSGLNREVVCLGRLSIESICVLAAVVTFPIRDYVLFTASTPHNYLR